MDKSTLIGIIITIIIGVPSVLAIICNIDKKINISTKNFILICILIIAVAIGIVLFLYNRDRITEPPETTGEPTIEETTKPTTGEATKLTEEGTTKHVVCIPLSDLSCIEDSNEENSTTDVAVGNWKDVFGNIHFDSIKFWVVDKPGWSNTEYITYQLNGQYETLTGLVVAGEDSESGAQSVISIYLDGQQEYKSVKISNSTQPVSFSIDVSGVNKLHIVCSTDVNHFGYCIFSASLS